MAKKAYPLRVDETLFIKFQKVADSNFRSVVGHIEFLMQQAVNEYEKEHGEIKVNPDDLFE